MNTHNICFYGEIKKSSQSYYAFPGPDKSIAQLPGTSPNFGWASDFLFHLPRKMYRIYREYCFVIPSHFVDVVECWASG